MKRLLRFVYGWQVATLIIAVAVVLIGIYLTSGVPQAKSNSQNSEGAQVQDVITHPALTQDIVSKEGTKLVEIIEATYGTTGTSLNGYFCRVRNNSDKGATALGLIWTATFSNGTTDEMYQFMDSRIHEDIAKAQGLGPLAPKQERVFRSSSTLSAGDGIFIETVKVKIDFVEFVDGSIVGGAETSKNYKRVILTRHGAKLCKSWLVRTYGDNRKNLGKVIEKLDKEELPDNADLSDRYVEHGAIIYRNWLLDVYKSWGSATLQSILKQK